LISDSVLAEIRGKLKPRIIGPDTTFGFVVDNQPYVITVRDGIVRSDSTPFLPPARDVTITLNGETLSAIMAGRQEPMAAYLTGKIKVEGSLTIARRVGELFDA